MPQLTIPQAIELGLSHHQAGRLREAEEMYRQVLQFQPDNPDGLHLLGLIAHQTKHHQDAIDLIRRAIDGMSDIPLFHYNLSEAYRALGRLDEAIASLRRAVELEPTYFEAHNNLAMVLVESRRFEPAVAAARRAIELDPNSASPWNNLGNALRELGKTQESVEAFETALKLRQDFPEALNNLGIAQAKLGMLDEAINSYRQAIKLKPDFADAYNNLGSALTKNGQYDISVECFNKAIQFKPDYAQAYNNLGAALRNGGRIEQAILCYEKALALKPDFPEALTNLALALRDAGRAQPSLDAVRHALELDPNFVEAHVTHGLILRDLARLDDAEAAYRQALAIEPENSTAHAALGNTLLELGRLDEAIASMRNALESTKDAQAQSNLCLATLYHPAYGPTELLQVHREWAADFENPPNEPIAPHENDRTPDRRLRVGYVSPDFRSHAVSHFVEPILANHDHDQFEIFCYSNWAVADATTTRLMRYADKWRDIAGLPDRVVIDSIRKDKIDILVDLAGHTANNRLPVFGMKPAPIQMSAIGYPCTTGLRAIDYRLTDAHCDPPGESDQYSSEKLLRLPDVFWCYQPSVGSPPISGSRSSFAARVTFGSVNNFAKVTPNVLELWAAIARQIPGSRLLLQASAFGAEGTRGRVRDRLIELGISEDRIMLLGWTGFEDYLRTIQQIDVGLDPFPFNGGTTTCHMLWMGVPLVTLAGRSHQARMGVSLLHAVGVPELIAQSPEQYVKIASALALDESRLAGLRATLRDRLSASPLTDGSRFTRNLESAYRRIWRDWCASSK